VNASDFQDGPTFSGPFSAFMQPGPARDEMREKEAEWAKNPTPVTKCRIASVDVETNTIWLESL
jgi:hypothetical protein